MLKLADSPSHIIRCQVFHVELSKAQFEINKWLWGKKIKWLDSDISIQDNQVNIIIFYKEQVL